MKRSILLLFLLLNAILSFSQSTSDTIEIRQRIGKVYMQNGKVLPDAKLYKLLNTNDKAALEVDRAKANLAPMYLFSFAGGFLIGWPIGVALAKGDPNWFMAVGGVGLLICSVPFQMGYNKHILKAVTIYNSDLKKIGISKKIMEMGLARDGLGFVINF